MARRGIASGKMGPVEDPFAGTVYEVDLAATGGFIRWGTRQIEPIVPQGRISPGGFLFRSAAQSLEVAIRDSGAVHLLVGREHA